MLLWLLTSMPNYTAQCQSREVRTNYCNLTAWLVSWFSDRYTSVSVVPMEGQMNHVASQTERGQGWLKPVPRSEHQTLGFYTRYRINSAANNWPQWFTTRNVRARKRFLSLGKCMPRLKFVSMATRRMAIWAKLAASDIRLFHVTRELVCRAINIYCSIKDRYV